MTALAFILSGLFPFLASDAVSCPLYNLNTLWYTCIIMILISNDEQVMTMCRVQECQLLLSYFLSYFTLMVSDAISYPSFEYPLVYYHDTL